MEIQREKSWTSSSPILSFCCFFSSSAYLDSLTAFIHIFFAWHSAASQKTEPGLFLTLHSRCCVLCIENDSSCRRFLWTTGEMNDQRKMRKERSEQERKKWWEFFVFYSILLWRSSWRVDVMNCASKREHLSMLYCVNMSMRWDYCASQDCHRFSNKTLEKTAFSNRRQMTEKISSYKWVSPMSVYKIFSVADTRSNPIIFQTAKKKTSNKNE